MSGQPQDYFCGNGHHVLSVEEACIPTSFPTNCQHCGNPDLYMVLNWRDSDYEWSRDIPYKPIRLELDRTGHYTVKVYDISKLHHKLDKENFLKNVY